MQEYQEEYVGDNKTWDDWVKANPNLVNLNVSDLLVYAPLKPYPWGWIEVTNGL